MSQMYLLAYDKRFTILSENEDHSKFDILGQNESVTIFKGSAKREDYKKFEHLDIPQDLIIPCLQIFSTFFFFMPDGKNLDEYLPSFLWPRKCQIKDSLTFFGGSFNPWHEGHSECLRQCKSHEKGIVILPDHSPWKDNVTASPLAEMIKISKITQKNYIIYPGFWISKNRNPTSSWIKSLSFPRVNWLMGDDTFINILSWHEVEDFFKKIDRIYVVPRMLENHNENLDELIEKLVKKVDLVFLNKHNYQDLSSTKIRNKS